MARSDRAFPERQTFISHSSGGWTFQIGVRGSASREPHSWVCELLAASRPRPPGAFALGAPVNGARAALWGLFSQGPGCMAPSNSHHLPKLLPSTSTLGVNVQHRNSGETPRAAWRDGAPLFRRCKYPCHHSTLGPACPHPGGKGARTGCSRAAPWGGGVRAAPPNSLGVLLFPPWLAGGQHPLRQPQSQRALAKPPFLLWGSISLRSHQAGGRG